MHLGTYVLELFEFKETWNLKISRKEVLSMKLIDIPRRMAIHMINGHLDGLHVWISIMMRARCHGRDEGIKDCASDSRCVS